MNNNKDKKGEHTIVVEIPVVLEKANVVFNMDHLAFAGDVSVGINYMRLLTNRFREMNINGQSNSSGAMAVLAAARRRLDDDGGIGSLRSDTRAY